MVNSSQKRAAKFPAGTRMWIGVAAVIAVLLIIVLAIPRGGVYRTIVQSGYSGTQEQWLASLVGEEADTGNVETAYELAVQNGYKGSEAEWIETLTGAALEAVEQTPYAIACENGFAGSLTEWLTGLADQPEKLGRSQKTDQKTEYEFACEYGYSGTFIEWLVSVTQDHVFE